jgi:hypothetical protein
MMASSRSSDIRKQGQPYGDATRGNTPALLNLFETLNRVIARKSSGNESAKWLVVGPERALGLRVA